MFVALEDGAGVGLRGLQLGENGVAHAEGGLEGCLFGAVLLVGEVTGELVPLAADAQSPALEGGGFVGIAGDVALCHGGGVCCCCCCLVGVLSCAGSIFAHLSVILNLTR